MRINFSKKLSRATGQRVYTTRLCVLRMNASDRPLA